MYCRYSSFFGALATAPASLPFTLSPFVEPKPPKPMSAAMSSGSVSVVLCASTALDDDVVWLSLVSVLIGRYAGRALLSLSREGSRFGGGDRDVRRFRSCLGSSR